MAFLLDELFLTKTDFADFRDISKNINDERIDAFIRESQIREIRTFLGDILYLKLLTDFTPPATFATPIYENLFLGVDYDNGKGTVRFNGLKAAHIMYAYKRMLLHQQVSVTRYGVKNMSTEFSEDTINAKIRSELVDSDAMGKVYQADAVKFIKANASDYPDWQDTETRADKSGFKFIKI